MTKPPFSRPPSGGGTGDFSGSGNTGSGGSGNNAGAGPNRSNYSGGAPGAYTPRPAGTGAPRPGGNFSGPRPGGFSGPRPAGAGGPPRPGAYNPAGGAGMAPRPPQAPRFNRGSTAPPIKDGPRCNEDIRAPEIRLVDEDGEMVGVVTVREGLERAQKAGLDLVEVSPNAEPPVCKILDYGKFRFMEEKKKKEAKKNQKVIEIKEIKLRPMIDDHDFDIKMAQAKRFFAEGDKVKITLRFRGRELSNQAIGMRVLDRVKLELELVGKIESQPNFEGRQVVMVMAPIK